MHTNLETDHGAGQLQNRWSGQGHRADLKRAAAGDDRFEALANRVGEERAMFLLEHPQLGTSGRGPTRGRNHPGQAFQVFQSGANPTSRGAENARPARTALVRRAASPSAFGRVRFIRGERVTVEAPSQDRTARAAAFVAPSIRKGLDELLEEGKSRPRPQPEKSAHSYEPLRQMATPSVVATRPTAVERTSPDSHAHTVTSASQRIASQVTVLGGHTDSQDPKPSGSLTLSDIMRFGIKGMSREDIIETTKIIFHPARLQWVKRHPGWVNALAHIGGVVRKEMVRLASLRIDHPDVARFIDIFGFIPDLAVHLEAARKARVHASAPDDSMDREHKERPHHPEVYYTGRKHSKSRSGAGKDLSGHNLNLNFASRSSISPKSSRPTRVDEKREPAASCLRIDRTVTLRSSSMSSYDESGVGSVITISGPFGSLATQVTARMERNAQMMLKKSEVLDGVKMVGGIYLLGD